MASSDDQAFLLAELRARRDRLPASTYRAVWELAMGETEQSLATLREGAVATTDEEAQPGSRWLPAVLAGDWDAAAREARRYLEHMPRFVRGYAEYMRTMLALVADDDQAARTSIEELDAYTATHEKLSAGQPSAVADIPRGILGKDATRTAAGLDALLAWHLRRARARSEIFNSPRAVVCSEAVVALLVAHRRGLRVEVSAKYRAAAVPLHAIHLAEWEGRPIDNFAPLSIQADLVAGPWLAAQGLQIGEPGAIRSAPPRGGRRQPKTPSIGASEIAEDVVRQHLRGLVAGGLGAPWQLVSWSVMLDDLVSARRNLLVALAEARRLWQESRPAGGVLRSLWRSQELPNSNYVRAHFGLALAAGDERALDETSRLLRAWMDTVAEDERRRGASSAIGPYGHADGYLDFLADLLAPGGPRQSAERVSVLRAGLRTGCIGLERRDAQLVSESINSALRDHTTHLERRTSPPAPLCEPAIHLAAFARRLGIPFETDPRYASYPVPIILRDPPGSPGRLGRLACDLLGTALFFAEAR